MASNDIEVNVVTRDQGSEKVIGSQKKTAEAIERTGRAATQTATEYRRTQGAAQNSANSTKNFSKVARTVEGIVPIYATLAANVFALSAAFNILRRNAALQQLEQSLESVGISAGKNLPALAKSLRDITDQAISTETALRATAIATSSGFSASELQGLTTVAKGASLALGRDLSDALDRLIRGTAKLEPEILDELGIIVRLDEASSRYAEKLNKTAAELTQFEKQQAFLNATLDQGLKKYSDIADSVDTNPYDKLAASFDNLQKSVLEFISPPLLAFVEAISKSFTALVGVLALVGGTIVSQVLPKMADLSKESLRFAKILQEEADASSINYGQAFVDQAGDVIDKIPALKTAGAEVRTFFKQVQDTPALLDNQKTIKDSIKKVETELASRSGKIKKFGKANEKAYREETAALKVLREELKGLLNDRRIASGREMENISKTFDAKSQENAANTFDRIAAARGPLSTVKETFAGISREAGIANTRFRKLNQELALTSGSFGKVGRAARRSSIFITSWGIATGNAISFAFRGFLKLLPLIGQIAIAYSFLKDYIDPVIESVKEFLGLSTVGGPDFFLGEEKVKELGNNLDSVTKSLEKYKQSMKDTSSTARMFTQGIKISGGVLGEFNSAIETIRLETIKKLGDSVAALEEEIASLEKAAEGQKTNNYFQNLLSLASSGDFAALGRVSAFGLLGWLGKDEAAIEVADNNNKKLEEVKEERNRILETFNKVSSGDLIPQADTASIVNSFRSQLENNPFPEIIKKQFEDSFASIDLSKVETLDDVDYVSTDQLNRLKQLQKQFESLNSSASSLPMLFGNLQTELNKFTRSQQTAYTPVIDNISALENELNKLTDQSLKSNSTFEDFSRQYSSLNINELSQEVSELSLLADDAKRLAASLDIDFDPQTTTLKDLVGIVGQFRNVFQELEDNAITVKARVDTAKAQEKELNRLRSLAPEFTQQLAEKKKEVLDIQLQSLNLEISSLSALEQSKQTEKEIAAVRERISQRDAILAEQKQLAIENELDIMKAQNEIRQRNIGLAEKELSAQNEILKAQQDIANINLSRLNRAQFAADPFSGFANRQQERELENRIKLEESLIADKIKAEKAGLELTKEKIKLEYNILRDQALLAAQQAELAQSPEIAASLRNYAAGLDRVKGQAIQGAEAAANAAIATIQESFDATKEELRALKDDLATVASSFAASVSQGLADLVRGTGIKDVFTDIANSLLDTIAQVAADRFISEIINSFTGEEPPEKKIENAGNKIITDLSTSFEQGGKKAADKITQAYDQIAADLAAKCSCPIGANPEIPVASGAGIPETIVRATHPDAMTDEARARLESTTPQIPDIQAPQIEKNTESTNFLTEALGENTQQTLTAVAGLSATASALLGNTEGGRRLAKVTQALTIATIALKVAIAVQKAADGANFLAAFAGANGGIAPGGIKPFATGGMVTKPTIGLVGEGKYNEAIVPLPDGRSIPVSMNGGGVDNSTVNVTVNIDQSGNATTEGLSGEQGARLGKQISTLVKLELQNQQRSGGILSPY